MFALLAAVVCLVGLIFEWADVRSTWLTFPVFVLLALLLIALQIAGILPAVRRRD